MKVGYTVTIPQRAPVRAAIDNIAERPWQRIDYPRRRSPPRRVRLPRPAADRAPGSATATAPKRQLFATWRYHAFVTNLAGSTWALDQSHRAHAVVG